MKLQVSVLLFICVCVITLAFMSELPMGETIDEGQEEQAIREHGGVRAYGIFAESVHLLSPSEQHERAHRFGAALYEIEGVEGISACDDRFSYGCFHEFLGRAIAIESLSIVPELNDRCQRALIKSALACQHGIGHGILAFLGYDEDALKEALSVCESLPYADPIGGCYGGVFMEYNVRTMLGTKAEIRPLTQSLYDPCKNLRTPFEEPCYFWQTQWWLQVLREDRTIGPDMFKAAGDLCEALSPEFAKSCFEGLGNLAPAEADFNPTMSAILCDATSDNPQHRLYCRSSAANSLTVGGSGRAGNGALICQGLEPTAVAYCEEFARKSLH